MSLKFFSSLTIRNIDNGKFAGKIVPRDIYPWLFKCDFDCQRYKWASHEVCMYTMARNRDSRLAKTAAGLGDVRWFTYAHENGFDIDECSQNEAAENGRLAILKFMHEKGLLGESLLLLNYAIKGGHVKCIEFLIQVGYRMEEVHASLAAFEGHVDCLRYLHERGCPWDERTSTNAASRGSIDCLRYACEHGCPVTSTAIYEAASSGRLECLDYLYRQGLPLSRYLADAAAVNGELETLQYLYRNGCPIDVFAICAKRISSKMREYLELVGNFN